MARNHSTQGRELCSIFEVQANARRGELWRVTGVYEVRDDNSRGSLSDNPKFNKKFGVYGFRIGRTGNPIPQLYFLMLHCQGKGAYQAGRNVIPSLGDQHVRNLRRNCLQHCYFGKVLRHSRGLGFTTLLNRMINISQRNDNLGVNYFIGPG